MRKLKQIMGLSLILVMLLALTSLADAAAGWRAKYERISAVAGETLATGNVVCISGSDGYAYKADADDSTLRPAIGIVGKGGSSGATVEIVTRGILTGQTAASPGARLFLDATTAGTIAASAPTNAQPVGWVMPGTAGTATSTTYYINVNIPNSAGAAY